MDEHEHVYVLQRDPISMYMRERLYVSVYTLVYLICMSVYVCMCVWIEWYRERHTRSLFQIPEHMKLSHEIEKERE